jgi:hypothetical protein
MVITHRGLDPTHERYFPESSLEAFEDQLGRGYGLEFDVRLTRDGTFAVIHDGDLSRATEGVHTMRVADIDMAELARIPLGDDCRIPSLSELLEAILRRGSSRVRHALHLKSALQDEATLAMLLSALEGFPRERFLIFDAAPGAAGFLKREDPSLSIAPSVAHPYDIERFNASTGGTLLSLEDAIRLRHLYDWAWLDEWDLKDRDGEKHLYTREVFERLRSEGFRIALVTPELHRNSPGLIGGEMHEDAADDGRLMGRIREIVALRPDAICTDHPDQVASLISAL